MEEVYQPLISYINNFLHLPADQIDQLKTIFTYKKLFKKEFFLKAGDFVEYLGFNINGAFRYYYIDYEGKERTKYFIIDHDFVLSLSSFIERKEALYSIEALKDSEILMAPVSKVYDLINSSLYWRMIYQHIIEKTYVLKEKREAEFLLYDAKMRYLNFLHEYPTLGAEIKQHYIASYLGITPESLSRIRSEIEKS